MTDKSLILWYLYTAHSLFNVEWQNELCDITMALVSIARLYCAVVLNDVMQPGQDAVTIISKFRVYKQVVLLDDPALSSSIAMILYTYSCIACFI